MAHWGVAYATGPNYNKAWDAFDPADLAASLAKAFTAAQRALACAGGATPAERALIAAIAARYPAPAPPVDAAAWNEDYARAMRGAYRDHPGDLDIAALFADALLNVTPWQLWDLPSGEPASGAHTPEAARVLELALERPAGTAHPGVLHMYIHLMEMSPHPERAMRAADSLRALVPDGGHLLHMPTHIDVLCGDYRRVVASNSDAIAADQRFLAREGPMNFYTLYRAHNYHFKIYGAMFAGQQRAALEAADELRAALPEELLRVETPPMADWLEGFVPMRMHALIRFGRWPDIIAEPLPGDQDLYCVTTAMTHYAKGVALAATGDLAGAAEQRRLFQAAAGRVPASRTVFNNTCLDILAIAAAMLDGELDYRKGRHDAAFAHLRRSIELDDGLPYDEPWGWMQPARHAYGALLLEQGRVAAAEAVYRADLGLDGTLPRACHHPGNVWALHGYHECLVRLGKQEQAQIIGQQLELAAAAAAWACRPGSAAGPAVPARGSGSHVEVHPDSGAEPRPHLVIGDEAGLSVEDERVLVRGHLDAAHPQAPRDRHRVQHKRPAGSPPHPAGVHEQVVELDDVAGRHGRGEAGDAAIGGGDPGPPVISPEAGEFERIRVGQQVLPVTLVGQRRVPVHIPQRGQVGGHGVPDHEGHRVRHRARTGSRPSTPRPAAGDCPAARSPARRAGSRREPGTTARTRPRGPG
jgi:tetratricopeptide (TPR) repeat protein